MFTETNYNKIIDELIKSGYEPGDDITYFEFIELCDDIGIDIDDINLDNLCEISKINIS